MQKTFKKLITLVTVFSMVTMYGLYIPDASAAALTAISDTMSTQTASSTSDHLIRFTTPTGASEGTDTITLTFSTEFDMKAVEFGDIDLSYDGTDGTGNNQTIAAAAGDNIWGAAISGKTLTLTYPSANGTAITAGWKVIVKIGLNASGGNAQIENPATPASSYSVTLAGTFGDTGVITLPIVTDDTVSLSGTLAQTISFSISSTTLAFGSLDSGNPRYAYSTTGSASAVEAHRMVASTNSLNGYTITASGTTLTLQGSSTVIITPITGGLAASNPGTEQFGLNLQASGGAGAVDAAYNHASTFAFESDMATGDRVAYSDGASLSTTYVAQYLANVGLTTEYGTYSTSVTYIATGNF